MSLGAGLVVALAVAASAAGRWLLAGIVAAAVLVTVGARFTGRGADDDRAGRWLRAGSWAAALVVAGVAFAAYLGPSMPVRGTGAGFAAAGLVVGAVLADALGVRPGVRARRWVTGVLLVAAAAFVAVCVAIPPPDAGSSGPGPGMSASGAPGLPGAVVATVVFVPVFAGLRTVGVLVGAVVATAVGAAALYQVGPVRLGLSASSLRDVLTAADARALTPALTGVVVLATVGAAVAAAGRVRRALGPGDTPAGLRGRVGRVGTVALVVGTVAALVPVTAALVAAGALFLVRWIHAGLTGARR